MTFGNKSLTKVGCLATVMLALFGGGASAAVLLHRLILQPGQCATIAKTRVCAAKAPTVTVTTTPVPAVAFKDGTFRVGVDIQPGTYKAVKPSSGCYWARLSGFTGALDAIIDNGLDQTIVTIEPTDVGFQSSMCGGWAKA